MYIALYEENNYHTEIFGTFIYYCKLNNIQIDYYNDKDMSSFYEHYIDLFKISIPRYKNIELNTNIDKYDYIIIGTMGKINQINDIFYQKLHKFICIFHNYDDPLPQDIANTNIRKLVMTPLNKNVGEFLLPIFKPQIEYNRSNGKLITMIGRFKNRNWREIMPLVESGYSFQILTRREKMIPKELVNLGNVNVRVILRQNAINMSRYINKSNYLLCVVEKDSWYYKDRLSGMIPLSFNYRVPLLIPKDLNNIYGFSGVIEYDSSENLPKILENLDYNEILKKLDKNSATIISNNNILLNNIFS